MLFALGVVCILLVYVTLNIIGEHCVPFVDQRVNRRTLLITHRNGAGPRGGELDILRIYH